MLLSASLSTCDPGDIHQTAAALRNEKVVVSIFSMLAEVYVCKKIANDTGGDFGVPIDVEHLRSLVMSLVPPRPTEADSRRAPAHSLVRVGFPCRAPPKSVLAFSPAGGLAAAAITDAQYQCPQCSAYHTELPTGCAVCKLKLMSSVELTKTHHHLFPVPTFTEATLPPRDDERARCFACGDALPIAAAAALGGGGAAPAPMLTTGYEPQLPPRLLRRVRRTGARHAAHVPRVRGATAQLGPMPGREPAACFYET